MQGLSSEILFAAALGEHFSATHSCSLIIDSNLKPLSWSDRYEDKIGIDEQIHCKILKQSFPIRLNQ